MKGLIKRRCVLLITFLLCLLVFPKNVYAASTQLKLIVAVNRTSATEADNTVVTYNQAGLSGGPDSTSIPGLTVSFDSSTNTFDMEVTGTVDLKGYLVDPDVSADSHSLIYTNGNLNITGNGTLNMTVLSNPSGTHDSYNNAYDNYAFITAYGFNAPTAGEKITIGDDSNGPTINMKVNTDSADGKSYVGVNGFCIDNINIKQSTITYEGIGVVFWIAGNTPPAITERVFIENSDVTINFKKLGDNTSPYAAIFLTEAPAFEGSFCLNSSTLNFTNQYNDYSEVVDPTLILCKDDNQQVNLTNSTVNFNDSVFCYIFAHAKTLVLDNSTFNAVSSFAQTDSDILNGQNYFIKISGEAEINNSNFDIESTRPVFFGDNEYVNVRFKQTDEGYTGKVNVFSDTTSYIFTKNSSGSEPANYTVTFTSDGTNYLKVSEKAHGKPGYNLIDNPDFLASNDATMYKFEYSPNDGDSADKIKWNYFEISPHADAPEEEHSSSSHSHRHIVLNTSVSLGK